MHSYVLKEWETDILMRIFRGIPLQFCDLKIKFLTFAYFQTPLLETNMSVTCIQIQVFECI